MSPHATDLDREWEQKYILDPATRSPGSSSSHHYRSSSNSSNGNRPTSRNSSGGSFHHPNLAHRPSSTAGPSSRNPRLSPVPSTRPPSYHSLAPTHHRSQQRSSSHSPPSRNISTPPLIDISEAGESQGRNSSAPSRGHRPNRSLDGRFPGDMSHRPLDILRQENRAAERTHRKRSSLPGKGHRSRPSVTDTIDNLDTIGGAYHHGGPYDATLASNNLREEYSPLAAVRDSNMEAIRATPREFIKDSLDRHVPLQGTALVPNGGRDMSGDLMEYEEGADLMREKDAAGGAYKRWEGFQYHPDDLKGKGEPSYTIERDLKKGAALEPGEYEMGSMRSPRNRQRSSSNVVSAQSSSLLSPGTDDAHVRRSNTTGKKISDGLKRRLVGMGKKREEVH